MTNAIETIVNSLNEIFVEMDARVLVESQIWAKDRVAAIKEFKASNECKFTNACYHKLYEIAGGKTWYNVFNGRDAEMIEQFVIKNCASIAAKLTKSGVTSVDETTFNRTTDGFHGVFVVQTDKGRKVVEIETIYAGGYNIQCLHLRTLVKVC